MLFRSGAAPVWAAGIGTWATDDSVCDFGNGAPYLIERKLIPKGGAPHAKYVEVTLAWIAGHCANGQQLRLGDSVGNDDARRLFAAVANETCTVASVEWEKLSRPTGGITQVGFAVRCTISKIDVLKEKYGGGDGGK